MTRLSGFDQHAKSGARGSDKRPLTRSPAVLKRPDGVRGTGLPASAVAEPPRVRQPGGPGQRLPYVGMAVGDWTQFPAPLPSTELGGWE